jgi:dihydroorotate dehydrogenase electron transfer subunit
MIWLDRQHAGTPLDLFGPLGTPFTLDTRTRTLLLIGVGEGLGGLFLLARAALRQHAAVVLLTAAPTADLLPPPFLLPAAVEYRGSDAGERSIADLLYGDTPPADRATATSELIAWADQIGATLPPALLPPLISAVRTTRLRWQRGFAQVILPGAMPCGTGACLGCLIETHNGMRTRCKDGPVFDLRDMPARGE